MLLSGLKEASAHHISKQKANSLSCNRGGSQKLRSRVVSAAFAELSPFKYVFGSLLIFFLYEYLYSLKKN